MLKSTDFKPEQPTFHGRSETDVLLPPSTIEIENNGKNFFSIVLGEPKDSIYLVSLIYEDSHGTKTLFYYFEMIHLLKNTVKVDVNGSIINFSFEIYPIDDESVYFSDTFIFSNSSESKFELGNSLKSMPVHLPLNGVFYHICFDFFSHIILKPKTEPCEIFDLCVELCETYEIIIIQSSRSSADGICKIGFEQGDKVIQKITLRTWDSGFPSIRRDHMTGNFFVASESDDPNKKICIDILREYNLLINLPDPVKLLADGTLVLDCLSIPFGSEKDGSVSVVLTHLSSDMYLFQSSIHPTIQKICIVKSYRPDSWRPQRTQKYFSDGDIIVKKIYLRTGNPIDILKLNENMFMLGTDGNDDFAGYLLKVPK
jgi:hypothetical protein